MTPAIWHRAATALTPHHPRILVAAGIAAACLALAVAGVKTGVMERGFFAIFGVCAFVGIEAWGLALITWWFGERADQSFRALPAGWRRSTQIVSRWYLSLALIVWFVAGFVFLFISLLPPLY